MSRCKYVFFVILTIVISLCGCNMNDLPKGEFMDSFKSPDSTYTVNSYLCSGNATTDFSVRCEVVKNKTGETRNIYWDYHQEEANVKWLDDENVEINNHKINVINESYDWRDY